MKTADETVTEEGEAAGDPMARSSMEWTSMTSADASTQAICNRWAMKETPTSPRSAHIPTRKYMVASTTLRWT